MAYFSGHMQQLAPGVVITGVTTDTDPMTLRNTITLELSVDGARVDVFSEIVRGLQRLVNPGYSPTSPTSYYVRDDTADEVMVDPPEANGGGHVTMEALREELLARLDDVDRALRLLVDP